MPNDNLKKLWTNVSNEYDLPDLTTFEKDMQDEANRKKLWSAIAKDYDLPDFEQFSDDMGFKKKVPTKLQPQQTPSQTSSTASLPPLGQKPKPSESVTPSTSKSEAEAPKTNGYAVTTPDSVETGDNLVTVKSQEEKAREKAIADEAERLRIQAKYHDTVLNWEKQPKEVDRTGGLEITENDGKVEVGSVFDNSGWETMKSMPLAGTPGAAVQLYDADFSEYLKRTNRFRDQVGSIAANKVNNDNVAWIKTELPKILKQDKEYIAADKELKAAHTQLQQLVARGEMPIEEAESQLAKLSEQFNANANALAARYYKERENKSKEEFQKFYAEELQRSAKKIKGPEYYAAMTEVFKSQAFKGLSIDDKKEWIRQAWKKEEDALVKAYNDNPNRSYSKFEKEHNDLYDEFMRNMVQAVSYDDNGNPTSYALKEMAAEKLAKITADYNTYINTHPDRYGAAADMSPTSAKLGKYTPLDSITEQYQRSMKMLQDVISAPNETQEIGFKENLKAGNFSMLWEGMKSQPPLPFIRPLDELLTSTIQSAISKKDPSLWSESERAMMDGVAIKETFDRASQANPWYSMGKGLSGSLEYVGEFLATGGVYSGIGGATERAALKMLKIPSRTIEKGVVTAAENLTAAQATRYWAVGRPLKFLLASAAQTAANPQRYLNGIVQRMSPGVELALSEDGDELIAALDKNYKTPEGYRTGHNQGALEATARSFGETWSEMGTERMGDGVTWLSGQMARGALKGVKSVDLLKRLYIGYYMSKFGLNKTAMMSKIISEKLGWHGFVPELAEEIVNMPLSNIATGEAPVMKGLIKDTGEIDWDNLGETAGVVLLQSPIMGSPHLMASAANYIGEQTKDPMRMAVYDENGLATKVDVSPKVVDLIRQARTKDFKSLIKLKEEELPKLKLTPDERAVANRMIDSIIYEATDPTAMDEDIKSIEAQLAKPETEGAKRKMYEETLDTLKQKKKEAERAGEKRKEFAANANTLTKQLREFDNQLKNQLQKVANVARQPDIEDEENAGDFTKAEKVSMKVFNGEELDDNDKGIAAAYPKLIKALTDIEVDRKASLNLEKTKTDFNEGEYNKGFDQRKAQILGTVEKQPKQDKNRLKWAGKVLMYHPEVLEALMALTPKGYQAEAMKQLAGEFGIEGPVTSVEEFIMRLNETTLFQDDKKEAEQEQEQATPIPVSTLKNKPVLFNKRKGILTIDEGGKVAIETSNKIYELEAGPDSDANEFNIQEVKVIDDDIKITDVTEETVTVNGESYRIKTDKKGSITRLIGKKDIKDEETLAAVESERNKLPAPEVVKKKIESNPAEVITAIGEVLDMSPLELNAINRLLELNMTDEIAASLDRMLEGEAIEDSEYFKISLWSEDAINRLEKLKADIPHASEYIEELINGLYNILNEIPNESITEKSTEKSGGEANDESSEPDTEEGSSNDDAEEVEPEPEGIYGKSGKALITADEATEFTYKLIEADDLQPSHLPGGERNPNHLISAAQPKERNDKDSRDAQDKIAANPEMSRLGQNENIYFGAPVVNTRNEAIQGNNRSIGLKKHYSRTPAAKVKLKRDYNGIKSGTIVDVVGRPNMFVTDITFEGKNHRIDNGYLEKVAADHAYKTALAESAEQYGFTKDQVLAMKNPILVREVDVTDDEAIVMGQHDVKDLESGGKQRIDPITLSRKISQQDRAKIASIVFAEDKTVNAALRDNIDKLGPILNGYINSAQRQTAYNENGELTDKGASDFTEAISHFLFLDGAAVLPTAFEELSAKTKLGLQKSLSMIFGVPEEASLLPEVQNAILILYKYHASNVSSFENWVKTTDMFTGDMPINIFTPLELVMAEMIDNAPSQVAVKNIFGAYANLINGSPGDMFTPKVEGIEKEEAVNQVFFNNKPPKYGKGQKPDGKGKPDNKKPEKKPGEEKGKQTKGLAIVKSAKYSNVDTIQKYEVAEDSEFGSRAFTFVENLGGFKDVDQSKPFAVAYFGDTYAVRSEFAYASNTIEDIIKKMKDLDVQEGILVVYNPTSKTKNAFTIYPFANEYTNESVGLKPGSEEATEKDWNEIVSHIISNTPDQLIFKTPSGDVPIREYWMNGYFGRLLGNKKFKKTRLLLSDIPAREDVDQFAVQDYKDSDTFKPIVAFRNSNNEIVVVDGNHRVQAAREKNEKYIDAYVAEIGQPAKQRKTREDLIQEKRKIRDEKLDKELGDALDDLLNIGIDNSPEKQVERFEKSNKILTIYFKKGIFKIADILEDIMLKIGDKLDQFFFDAIKKAYFAYQSEVTSVEELDKMTTPKEGMSVTYETIKNKIEDELKRELESLEPDSGPGSPGDVPGENEDAELPPTDSGEGGVDGEGGSKGNRGGGKRGSGGGGPVGTVRKPASDVGNYNLGDEAKSPESFNPTQRYQWNVDAIKLLTELLQSGKQATPAQQEILAKYAGFGGLKEIRLNPDSEDGWADSTKKYKTAVKQVQVAVNELEQVLKEQGRAPDFSMWQYLRESIDTSFYTPFDLVHGVFDALKVLGFKEGKILEPSAGIGNFFMGMPTGMAKKSMLHGIEYDHITGHILKQLFPNADTHIGSFEYLSETHDSYDLIVSNIPFGDVKLKGEAIHNYFFRQAMDNVREGGIIAFITSTGVMDAMNESTRKYLNDNGYFLGAVRVGNKAFKAANTSVTSDIIFIQKKGSGIKVPKNKPSFLISKPFTATDGATGNINEYFHNYPASIIGTIKGSTFVRGASLVVESPDGIDHRAAIKAWAEANLSKVYDASKSIQEVNDTELVKAEKSEFQKVNNLYFKDGRLSYIQGFDNDGHPLIYANKFVSISKDNIARVPLFIKMRNTFNKLVYLEYHDYEDAKVEAARSELNRLYEQFTSQFGLLSDKSNSWMELDVDGYSVRALETKDKNTGDIRKSDILIRRTIKPLPSALKADNIQEAILVSLSSKGKIDTDFIAELLGKKFDEIDLNDLLLYDVGKESWVVRDEMLSGNVRRKLREAKKAMEDNQKLAEDFHKEGYQGGVFRPDFAYALSTLPKTIEALEAVQPADVPSSSIYTPIGARWVPKDVYEEFARHIFGNEIRIHVNHYAHNDKWVVDFAGHSTVKMDGYKVIAQHMSGSGLKEYKTPQHWLEAALNNDEPKIMDTVDEKPVYNEQATMKAINVFYKIRDEFSKWAYSDLDRRDRLTSIYNEIYNDTVLRTYNGAHLSFPGLTKYILDPHQKDAIWMLLQLRGGIVDHMVGAGKSLVAVSAIMEMRRLGIARKPMISGLKSQLPQMIAAFKEAYPHAKILTLMKETDFSASNRKRILSQIATNDWDCVIITHDNFNSIRHDKELQIEVIQEELLAAEESLRAAKTNNAGKQFEKAIDDKIKSLREKMAEMAKKTADDEVLSFQQLGVDMLFVDESQKYKNLPFTSKLGKIKGLGNQKGSIRAFNMQIAARGLHKLRGADEGLVFMSGTPISNSLSEMYLLMKYMRPALLNEKGIKTFDQWVDLFAVSKRDIEFYMGRLKEVNRFRMFGNAPELFKMYREVADVRNETNLHIDRPKAKHHLVKVKMTPLQKKWYNEIQLFISDKGRSRSPVSSSPNARKAFGLLAVHSAKLMSIDLRLIMSPREWESYLASRGLSVSNFFGFGDKLKTVTDNVVKIFNDTTNHKGVQLIFCDIGVPKSKNIVENLYALLEPNNEEADMEQIFGKTGEEFWDLEKKPSVKTVKEQMKKVLDLTDEEVEWAVKESDKETFDSYREMKAQLIEKGVPEDQITFIHQWNGKKRSELYKLVNNGDIRIVIGSTEKMGVGVSIQERAVAGHHVDISWKPSDVEQRNGRIERRGNWVAKEHYNNEVDLYYYALDQSLDAYMYGLVGAKAAFIRQQRTSNLTDRWLEEMDGGADIAEMASLISGNPDYLKKVKTEKQIRQLEEEETWVQQQVMDAISASRKREQWIADRKMDKASQEKHLTIYKSNYPRVERTAVGEAGINNLFEAMEMQKPLGTTTIGGQEVDFHIGLLGLLGLKTDDFWVNAIDAHDKIGSAKVVFDAYKKAQQRIKDRVVKKGEKDFEIVDAIESAYQNLRQYESELEPATYEVTLKTPEGDKVYTSAKEAGEAFVKYKLKNNGHIGVAYGFDIYSKLETTIQGVMSVIEIRHNGVPISKNHYALPERQLSLLDEPETLSNAFIQIGKALRGDILDIENRIDKINKDIALFESQIQELAKTASELKFEKQEELDALREELEILKERIREEEEANRDNLALISEESDTPSADELRSDSYYTVDFLDAQNIINNGGIVYSLNKNTDNVGVVATWADLTMVDSQDFLLYASYDNDLNDEEGMEVPREGARRANSGEGIKKGVLELFESYPELATIGTPEQYSQYLDSIFPDSKVKDIVYHGGTLNINDRGKDSFTGEFGGKHGIYFTGSLKRAMNYIKGKTDIDYINRSKLYSVLINIKNPLNNAIWKRWKFNADTITDKEFKQIKQNNADGIINKDFLSKFTQYNTQYVVFEPEQIYELGSQQDIKGFENWMNTPLTPVELEAKSSILDKLERLKIDTSGRQTYALPFPPQLWNGFISAIQIGVKAGERLAFAINRGVAYLKEQNVKNIDDYVKQAHETLGIPYVPGNPFQPDLDRPIFNTSVDAQEYLNQNYISGFEPRPINGQFTIAPIGEKSLAERINEMGEVSLEAVLHKLLPLGYTQTEIEVMYDVLLNDLVATLNKQHGIQNLGTIYGPIDRTQPDGPDYFKSRFIRPILFRGTKSGVRPFTVSQRIRDLFIKELGFDIQERMLQKRYAGVYKHQSNRVRVQSLFNVIVAAHEGMHAIDFNESTPISTRVASLTLKHPLVKELEKIYLEFYPTAKQSAPTRTKIVEGMAVLIERYCQDPIDILKRYPMLVDEFIDPNGMFYVPKTTVLIDGIKSIIQDYSSLPKDSMRIGARMSQVANEKNPLWYKNVSTSNFRRGLSKLKFFLFNTLEPARFIDQIAGTSYTNSSFESVLAARRRLYGIIDPWIHGKAPAIIYDGHGNYTEVGDLSIANMLKGLSEDEIMLLNAYLIARRGMDDLNNKNIAKNAAEKAYLDYKDEEAKLNQLLQQFGTNYQQWTQAQKDAIDNQSQITSAHLSDYYNKKSQFHRLEKIVVKDRFDISAARGTLEEVELQPGDDAATRKNKMKILRAVSVYDNINQSLLDYAYNGGLINRDKYIEWKNNRAYASFQRHITDDMNNQSALGVQYGISKSVDAFRKREGSDLEIMMPVYSQISHINQVITNVHENLAWQALEKIALRDSEVGRLFEKHQARYVNQNGRMVALESQDDTFVKVLHQGKASWYKISPELAAMRKTFNDNGFDFGYGIGSFFNAMGTLGRFTSRMITTAYPLFFLINLPVDTISKIMNAPAGGKGMYRLLKYLPTSASGATTVAYNALTEQLLNTLGNTMLGYQVNWSDVNDKLTSAMPVGMQNLLSPVLNKLEKTAEQYRMYSSLGARAATMASTHMSPSQRLSHIKTINASIWKKLITFGPGYTSRLGESIESIISLAEIPSNTSEYLIRFETYKQAKAQGDNDMLAMFKAEQATVAFVQHGANSAVAALMRSMIFANAGMQVFYRYGSSWAHHPKRMAVIHSLFAAASIIMVNALLDLPDDDKRLLDGQSLEEWGRYFTYKLPGDKNFTRVRIPDQLGFVNMLVWYTMRNNKEVGDKELEGAFKSAASALSDVDFINASANLLTPNPLNLIPVLKKGGGIDVKNSAAKMMNTIPTFTKTAIEAGLGVRTYPKVAPLDAWMTGEDVDKYDKYTSELAKTMAAAIGGTPIQHDHFIRGTLGRSFQLTPWIGQNKEIKNPLVYSPEGREFKGAYFNEFYESFHTNQQSKESLMSDIKKDGLTVMHKAIIDNYVAHLKDDNVKQLTFEEFRNKFPNISEAELEKTWRRTNGYFDWLIQKDVADLISELRTFYKDFNTVPKNVPVAMWKMIEASIAEPRYNAKEIADIVKNKLATPEFKKELTDIVKSSISQLEK